MAGTDRTKRFEAEPAPAIVLVRPQLAVNMGMAARAMLNFGLTDLRIVNPREDHLDERGIAASAGAERILRGAKVFDDLEAALADCKRVFATTARRRDMVKPVLTPRAYGVEARTYMDRGEPVAVLFGREKAGLSNDDIALADVVVEAALNPAYSSLNLSQAVLLMAYEWHQAADETPSNQMVMPDTVPATKEDLHNFYRHLESQLDECGFLRVVEKRPAMIRNLRNLFNRAGLTEQEVNTLHGVIKELRWGGRKERRDLNNT